MWDIIKLIIIGVAGGLLGGMGMGGGTLLIPLLVIAGGLAQHTAQAVNLIAFVPMAAVALILHIKNKLVRVKGILYIIIPAVAAAALAAWLARGVSGEVLGRIFGGFLALLGVVTIIKEIIGFKNKDKDGEDDDKTPEQEQEERWVESAEDYYAEQKRQRLDK